MPGATIDVWIIDPSQADSNGNYLIGRDFGHRSSSRFLAVPGPAHPALASETDSIAAQGASVLCGLLARVKQIHAGWLVTCGAADLRAQSFRREGVRLAGQNGEGGCDLG